jgi:hypothetical protein
MRKKLAAAVGAVALVLVTATPALAGEVTGSGKSLEPLHGRSICAYSGLNDDPTGIDPENGPPGRTQSYGQDVRNGSANPRQFHPGDACNPNADFGE